LEIARLRQQLAALGGLSDAGAVLGAGEGRARGGVESGGGGGGGGRSFAGLVGLSSQESGLEEEVGGEGLATAAAAAAARSLTPLLPVLADMGLGPSGAPAGLYGYESVASDD
jgi:hypothetical protein